MQQLDRRWTSVRRQALGRPRQVLFATPAGIYLATLSIDSIDDGALVSELAAVCAGQGPRVLASIPWTIGFSTLLLECRCGAKSCRLRATRTGVLGTELAGPGLARTDEFALLTTSHIAVDGYGHALIAARVLSTPVPDMLVALARRHLGPNELEFTPPPAEAEPLGIAVCQIGERARFVDLLYATAWTLERVYRRHLSPAERLIEKFSPTIQIPIAPGRSDDTNRFRRRVVPGLMSLAMDHQGALETLQALAARLVPLIAREAVCAGLLGRMRTAGLRLPVPISVKRRAVDADARPHPLAPVNEVLAGRGCLSPQGFAPQDHPSIPLFAGAAPGLDSSCHDARGGSVVIALNNCVDSACAWPGTLWRQQLLRSRSVLASPMLSDRGVLSLRRTCFKTRRAFSTSSSAAVMPLSIRTAQKELGVRPSVAQLVVPLGATINIDGTAMYQAIATVFLAQVTGIDLSIGALVLIVITAVGASIGASSTPGVGIVLLASVLRSAGIPVDAIALIIGVDRILDMTRTAVNVTGDLTACVVMDRWVGGPQTALQEASAQSEHDIDRAESGEDVILKDCGN